MKKFLLGVVAVAVLASGCGIAKPWPDTSAQAAQTVEHHTVLMVGDSLLGQTDYSLARIMTLRGFDATIIDAHVNGSGPLSPVPGPDGTMYPSTLDWMRAKLDAFPEVDTVVIEYGGACSTCDLWIPGSVPYGSQSFYDRWTAAATAMIDEARARGKLVLYTISPIVGNSGATIASGSTLKADVARVLAWIDEVILCAHADGCVDWWDPLVDTSDRYQTWLRYDGADRQVRYDDLVHITEPGSIRTATWTTVALDEAWLAQPKPFARSVPGDGQSDTIEAGDPITIGEAPKFTG